MFGSVSFFVFYEPHVHRDRRQIPAGGNTQRGELRAWGGCCGLTTLAKRLDAALEGAHGLPMTSYEVLHHLDDAEAGQMRMCDLAERVQLSRSGLTRLVDRLEREGLIERCSCEHDARGAYACLTERTGTAWAMPG